MEQHEGVGLKGLGFREMKSGISRRSTTRPVPFIVLRFYVRFWCNVGGDKPIDPKP